MQARNGSSKGVIGSKLFLFTLFILLIGLLSATALAQDGELNFEPEDDVIDVVGEMVNIIAGNAKSGLEQFKIAISLPSIVEGHKHKFASMSNVPIIDIPFKTEYGNFNLLVSLKDLLAP